MKAQQDRNMPKDNALEELRLRFVKGELNEDEYVKKKKVLES